MKIKWLGHSCFKIESGDYSIVVDPFIDGMVPGIKPLRVEANAVVCTHQHDDHNAVDNVEIIDGAEPTITVSTIETFHDDVGGSLRGPNNIYIFDDGKAKAAHLGDLGCDLTEDQLAELRGIDLLLIPVGGHYTIGPEKAAEITRQVEARYTVPMHYRSDEQGFGFDVIGTVDEYTKLLDGVAELGTSELDTDDELPGRILVLTPALL